MRAIKGERRIDEEKTNKRRKNRLRGISIMSRLRRDRAGAKRTLKRRHWPVLSVFRDANRGAPRF